MSYILDALRRADLERERGAVPGLNAQPAALPTFGLEATRSARPWVWALVGALVLVLAALAWYAFGRGSHPSALPPPASTASPTVPPAATPSPAAPGPALASSSPAAVQTTAAPPTPTAAQAPTADPGTAHEPARAPSQHAAAPQKTSRTPTRPDRKAATAERAQAPTTPAADSGDDANGGLVYTRNQLPEAIRNELPALSIGGASYSKSPASRMLIINGQVFHEGDTLGPNLTLKQIQLKAAVLEYKGYRYKVSF